MKRCYIGREGIPRENAAIKQAVEQLTAIGLLAGLLLVLLGSVFRPVLLPAIFGFRNLLGRRFDSAFDRGQAIRFEFRKKPVAVRFGKFTWNPRGCSLTQRHFVVGKPVLEIVDVEDRFVGAESRDGSQHRKQIVGLRGVHVGQAVLVVVLQQERAYVSARDFQVV